jgi:hypothetical protein
VNAASNDTAHGRRSGAPAWRRFPGDMGQIDRSARDPPTSKEHLEENDVVRWACLLSDEKFWVSWQSCSDWRPFLVPDGSQLLRARHVQDRSHALDKFRFGCTERDCFGALDMNWRRQPLTDIRSIVELVAPPTSKARLSPSTSATRALGAQAASGDPDPI